MNNFKESKLMDLKCKMKKFFVELFTEKPVCNLCLKKITDTHFFHLGGGNQCLKCGKSMVKFYFFVAISNAEMEEEERNREIERKRVEDEGEEQDQSLQNIPLAELDEGNIVEREDYKPNNTFNESRRSEIIA